MTPKVSLNKNQMNMEKDNFIFYIKLTPFKCRGCPENPLEKFTKLSYLRASICDSNKKMQERELHILSVMKSFYYRPYSRASFSQ